MPTPDRHQDPRSRDVQVVLEQMEAEPGPLRAADALALATVRGDKLDALIRLAGQRRDRAFGTTVTYSPKVFLPITNLCRNRCDYCTFRRSPGDDGAHTMPIDEVRTQLQAAADSRCIEALLCLGDTPEKAFGAHRRTLDSFGHPSTASYLRECAEAALELGLLPHTNAGILTADELALLRPVNVSMGLMLESTSERLCERGGPHFKAPDKRPAVRIAMTEEAARQNIPFTSGILIGIGETPAERVETLLEIRRLHRNGGNIHEVIVQNFAPKPMTAMAESSAPAPDEMLRTVALARLILPDDVTVQAPPNLNARGIRQLLEAGINDFGGISPVTPDFINPEHPWPHITALAELCQTHGLQLSPRLPTHDGWLTSRWLDNALTHHVDAARGRMAHGALVPAPVDHRNQTTPEVPETTEQTA